MTGAASSECRRLPFERISLFAGVVVWAKAVDISRAAPMVPADRRLRIYGFLAGCQCISISSDYRWVK